MRAVRRRKADGARGLSGAALMLFLGVAALPLAAALASAAKGGGLMAAMGRVLAAPSTLRATVFGLEQAALSTLVALAIGLPGAWLCARYDFPGKRLLRSLSSVPFCVPPILVVLAFVLYYGRSGILNRALMAAFGLDEPPITFLFSLGGLVLVHGFYNFPIVLQNVGSVWEGITEEREEAARSLGAGPFRSFLTGSLPSLGPAIAESAALVFLFCFFSFVVVLVFGPLGAANLEVEIYRAARFRLDPTTASALALVETAIALCAVLLFQASASRGKAIQARSRGRPRARKPRGAAAALLAAYGFLIIVFFLGPLLSLAAEAFAVKRGAGSGSRFGLGNFARLLDGEAPLLRALGDSLATAIPAALIATAAGCGLSLLLRRRGGSRLLEAALSLPLAVSGVVTSLGWSIIFPSGGLALISFVLAFSALPFAQRSMSAALATLPENPPLAARTLGAGRLRAVLEVELPAAAPVLLSTLAFTFSMAVGDANVPLLLGQGDFEPLPLLIYRLVGAYRFPEACAAGLALAALTGFIFFMKDKGDGLSRGR
jgi:thiamine transport system permease protein